MAASVVAEAEIPTLTVTMGSRVEYRNEDDATHGIATIVHPNELDFYDDAISILSPVGALLFGLSEGHSMTYAAAGGLKTITVKKILYQPEASQRGRA
jgi:regulator of nucleoside diphosphate kinase